MHASNRLDIIGPLQDVGHLVVSNRDMTLAALLFQHVPCIFSFFLFFFYFIHALQLILDPPFLFIIFLFSKFVPHHSLLILILKVRQTTTFLCLSPRSLPFCINAKTKKKKPIQKMTVAQGQEQSPRSQTRLSLGLNASVTNASSRAATILLPSVALMFALSCLFSLTPVQARTSAGNAVSVAVDAAAALTLSSAAYGNPLLSERTTTTTLHGLDNTPHADLLTSLEFEATTVVLNQENKARGSLRGSLRSTIVVDSTVVASYDSEGSRRDGGEGYDDRLPRSIITGHGGDSTDAPIQQADANDNGQHQLQRKQPAIAISEDQRMGGFEDLIGGNTSRSRASFASFPSFSLPPLHWIRTHLGTKSPYPHENRPVGLLDDTPEGYELVQFHLVWETKHFFIFVLHVAFADLGQRPCICPCTLGNLFCNYY